MSLVSLVLIISMCLFSFTSCNDFMLEIIKTIHILEKKIENKNLINGDMVQCTI